MVWKFLLERFIYRRENIVETLGWRSFCDEMGLLFYYEKGGLILLDGQKSSTVCFVTIQNSLSEFPVLNYGTN